MSSEIDEILSILQKMLVAKRNEYGEKSGTREWQLIAGLQNKIDRFQHCVDNAKDIKVDTIADLAGYAILLLALKKRNGVDLESLIYKG